MGEKRGKEPGRKGGREEGRKGGREEGRKGGREEKRGCVEELYKMSTAMEIISQTLQKLQTVSFRCFKQ